MLQEIRRLAEADAARAARTAPQSGVQGAVMGGANASVAAILDAVSRSPRRPRGSKALHHRPALAASFISNRAVAPLAGTGHMLLSSSA